MFNNRKKIEDEKFGFTEEEYQHPYLEKIFDCKLEATDRYNIIDFINKEEKLIIEIKRIRYNRIFPSWMIGKNKIEYIIEMTKEGYNCFIILVLNDGTKIDYRWDNNDFDKKNYRVFGRTDRGIDEENLYYYIPDSLFNILEDDDLRIQL